MVIFSHRGIGFGSEENSLSNLSNAIREGFSVEVDLRINGSRVILSHDESKENIFEFEGLMKLASEYPDILFALHLKENSDELINRVGKAIYRKRNCFILCTDFPQELLLNKLYKELGKDNLALYVTEREIGLNLIKKVDYLWLDETNQKIYKGLSYFKKFNKKIICCSPELFLSNINDKIIASFVKATKDQGLFGICTDFPGRLRHYFNNPH